MENNIPLNIVSVEVLSNGDMVCIHMNDGSTEVVPINNVKVQEYIDEHR